MKIKVKVGATVIVDGQQTTEQPSNWRLNGQPLEGVAQFLRGSQARVHQRGNVHSVISFQCAKEHAALQAAILYCFTHYIDMRCTGTADFAFVRDGGSIRHVYLANASCFVAEVWPQGVTTFATYKISGGQPTLENPS